MSGCSTIKNIVHYYMQLVVHYILSGILSLTHTLPLSLDHIHTYTYKRLNSRVSVHKLWKYCEIPVSNYGLTVPSHYLTHNIISRKKFSSTLINWKLSIQHKKRSVIIIVSLPMFKLRFLMVKFSPIKNIH